MTDRWTSRPTTPRASGSRSTHRTRCFPAGSSIAAGEATSSDALYLAYVYLEEDHREQGLGSALVRDVARAAADRGYAALEALGDRRWEGDWVLPVTFLAANGFRVVADDERFPLLRLDIRERVAPLQAEAVATIPEAETPGVGVRTDQP